MLTVIMDGNNLLYRIIKGKTYPDLKTTTGINTGGVYGVIQSVHKVWNSTFPNFGILVFDGGLSERRLKLYPDYKKRAVGDDPEADKERELFYEQKQYISDILKCVGIPTVELPGKEADDVIDYLVHNIMYHGGMPKIVILSEDIDLCQIVGRSNDGCEVELHRPVADTIITRHNAEEQLGYPLQYYIWYKALVGKTREVKGIEGIGNKTAINLINAAYRDDVTIYNYVEKMLEEGSKKPLKRIKVLFNNWLDVELGCDLSTIRLEKFTVEEQQYISSTSQMAFNLDNIQDEDIITLKEIFKQLEFMSMLSTFDQWAHPFLTTYNNRKMYVKE